uniref:ATP synthase complex subunit 8 n=1 Tax=Microporus nigrita TaxID=1191099 RepID=A0A2P1CLT0_9HEMI|nr:ATP synthase F0 subunit 8 [Aethus nigritus]AVJ52284.1 ATP synthase F0 subunit 8 [Microporus nigrita]UCC45899.1 ATP synthase F0 subunit 8 [Aethus nigritus]
MPQMAPIWWEMLFIMFITTFIIMSMMIYHITQTKKGESDATIYVYPNMNWKW